MVDAGGDAAGPGAPARTIRLGIDVDGTFTDIVGIGNAETGWRVRKVPSTPRTPNVAVLNAVDAIDSVEKPKTTTTEPNNGG